MPPRTTRQTAEYLYRLGDLQETHARTTRARPSPRTARCSQIALGAMPQARAALERLLLSERLEQRAEIVEILEPLFEQDGDAARLVGVLEARLAITPRPDRSASLLARIVELAEQRLSDRARALDAALRWLAIDPSSGQALAETERLAERLGQWPEVAARDRRDRPRRRGARRATPRSRSRCSTFLGRIQRERLGQLDEAAALVPRRARARSRVARRAR